MNDLMRDTFGWIKDDWNSNKFRFVIELFAWAISIGCSISMALTEPAYGRGLLNYLQAPYQVVLRS